MGVEVETRNLELAIGEDLKNSVLALEGTKVLPTFVSVKAAHGVVIPDVAGVEGRHAFPTLLDLLDLVFREQVAAHATTFHGQTRKVIVDGLLFLVEQQKRHLDDFCLAVGIRREIAHLRARLALRDIVFLVAGDTHHGETFHIVRRSVLAITIYHIIGRTVIVLVEHIDMDDLLPHKEFRLELRHHVLAILMEDDDVVHVGAVAHIGVGFLVLLAFQALACANEAFLLVDIKFLIIGSHGHGRDVIEIANLCLAFAAFAIFLLDM